MWSLTPIAFELDPSSSIDPYMLEDVPLGTANFDASTGELTWTSTYSYFEERAVYLDYACSDLWGEDSDDGDSWEDVEEPVSADVSTESTDGDETEGDEGLEEPTDDATGDETDDEPTIAPAYEYSETGNLSCSEEGYYYWGGEEDIAVESEEEDAEVDVALTDEATEPVEDDESEPEEDDEPIVDVPEMTEDTGGTMWDYGSYWSVEGVDVWTAELNAGDRVLITIDTPIEDKSFRPEFMVTNAEECAVAEGRDEFKCTASEDEEDCPASYLDVETSGRHYIIVSGWDGSGESAVYNLAIDDSTINPDLTLLADDISGYEDQEVRHTVMGRATVEGIDE